MMLIIECIIICITMWLICFLSTGTDEKNLKGLRSYPLEIQDFIRNNTKYKDKVKETNLSKVFISNTILFTIVLFIFGIFIKSDNYINNFLNVLILGEILNLFDLIVIDLLWWRNTPRIRFSDIPEKEKYQESKKHFESFFRGVIMYLLIAIIDGILLTII